MAPTGLIVDDHFATCWLIERVPSGQGNAVSTVGDGEAALAAVVTERPALVIAGLHLPGVDGVTILTHVRQHDPHMPLVAMIAGLVVMGSARYGQQ